MPHSVTVVSETGLPGQELTLQPAPVKPDSCWLGSAPPGVLLPDREVMFLESEGLLSEVSPHASLAPMSQRNLLYMSCILELVVIYRMKLIPETKLERSICCSDWA